MDYTAYSNAYRQMLTESTTTPENYRSVKLDLRAAYGELNGYTTRNVAWQAKHAVSREEAVNLTRAYIGKYNDFEPEMLNRLPDDSQIRLARESSVAVYVKTAQDLDCEELKKNLKADECSKKPSGEYRIWWD